MDEQSARKLIALILGFFFDEKNMCCNNVWRRIVPFAVTVALGLSAVNILRIEDFIENKQEKPIVKFSCPKSLQYEKGTGISGGSAKGLPAFYNSQSLNTSGSEKKTFKIVSKPRPKYTDSARQSWVQGTVRLRVAFLASGQVGEISPITNLPDGLTEQAVEAAKQIKFEPAIRNGKPITVSKIIEYNFALY